MKLLTVFALIFTTTFAWSQNHSKQNIRFIFETEHDIIGDFETNSKKIKLYNHQNRLLYEAALFEGNDLDETFFYYDKKNRLSKQRRISSNGYDSGIVELFYDKMGNLIQETEFSLKEEPILRVSMTYDKMGNMTHKQLELKHKTDNHLYMESYFDFSYSESGELMTKKGFENGLETEIFIFKYSNEGTNDIIEKFDANGKLKEKWIEVYENKRKTEYEHILVSGDQEQKSVDVKYGYDEFRNLKRERIYKNDKLSQTITFEYKYDNYGNWLEKREFKGTGSEKTETALIKRRIEYFSRIAYDHPPMELDEQFTFHLDANTKQEKLISTETHVRINDENGNVNWVSRRNGADIFQLDESQYEEGRLVKTVHLNNEKKENAYTVYEYNVKNQITLEASFSFEDKIDEKIIYTYNSKDQLVKKETYFTDMAHGNLHVEISEEFEYDEDGQKVKGILVEYGETYAMDFRWKGGRLIEYVQTPKGGEESPFAERYGYSGDLLTSIEIYDGGGKDPIEKEEHKFNGDGDILKSSFYQGEKLVEIINYEYFE